MFLQNEFIQFRTHIPVKQEVLLNCAHLRKSCSIVKFQGLGIYLVMPPSWARLGSARIQLELEAFQLGSARLVQILGQLVWKKICWNEHLLDFESLI